MAVRGRGRLRSGPQTFRYYVDSINGSDSNDGSSASRAFATLSKLDPLKANGLRVGLARGSVWEEELQWSAYTNVTIGSFGNSSLPLPHVKGSSTALNASFSLRATKVNTYQITWAHAVPSTNAYIQVWRNGVALTYVTTADAVEGTPGSFYADPSVTPTTVYVHTPASGNPATDGAVYEISRREHSIDLGNGGTIQGVWGSRNGHADGSLRAKYLTNCLMTEGLKHSGWVIPGGQASNCVLYKPLSPANRVGGSLLVAFENLGSAIDTYTVDCYFVDPHNYGGFTGCHAHTSGGGPVLSAVRHIRPRGYGLTQFVTAADTSVLSIQDGFAEMVGEGGSGGTLLSVDNLTLIIDAVAGSATGSVGRAFTEYGRIVARDVRVCQDITTSGALFFISQAGDDIRSCTFYGRTNNNTKTLVSSTLAGNYTVRDSVLYNITRPYNLTNASSTLDADNNVVFRQANPIITTVGNVASASWAAHLTNDAPDDANSANSDPLFTGNPQLGDFTLSPSSPAYTSGRNAGSTKTIARPNWTTLMTAWDAGYLGIDGTGP